MPKATHAEGANGLQNPRLDVYDPKTLAVMDQAFASIWATVRGPVRDMQMLATLELPSAKSF